MAIENQRVADPRDGFFDIKPAPEFFPPDYSLLWVLLGLFLLSILLFFILLWRRRRVERQADLPALSAQDRFMSELERLRTARLSQSVTVRELTSELSLALRRFIELRFGFAATDRTVIETLEQLTDRLGRASQQPPERVARQLKELRTVLRQLERTTFSEKDAERLSISSETLGELLSKAENLVNEFENLLAVSNESDSKAAA